MTHEDLKLGNIMVDARRELRIIDFTMAGPRGDPLSWQYGTVCYMPPERLFFSRRPNWATNQGPDIWAAGTILATLVLTARPIGSVLTPAEAFQVVDAQGCFNPACTNTIYDLLPSQEPWFAQLSDTMTGVSGLDKEFVEQGMKLMLWTRARLNASTFALPRSALKGLGDTPLFLILDHHAPALFRAYDQAGCRVTRTPLTHTHHLNV